jgi:dephospho-CoA kinase
LGDFILGRWSGKYVIGLTGNIATGKSVVRKMLEHLGAYGIDADTLAHRAVAKDAPGFSVVIQTFGDWILDQEGHIDRRKLAKVVFGDPEALRRLEAIIHPLVSQAIDILVRRAKQDVVVIEAIKLIESGLAAGCDSIWVVHSSEESQAQRLVEKRRMSSEAAHRRISVQPPQEEKLKAANVVIENDGSFDHTWEQVQEHWAELPRPEQPLLEAPPAPLPGELRIRRGLPQDAQDIAKFITEITRGKQSLTRQDMMANFGQKAFLLIERDGQIAGAAGWQVENLVARIDELYFDRDLPLDQAIPILIKALDEAASELQSEAALLFLPPSLAQHVSTWRSVGYRPQTVQSLGVRAWQDAARESMPRGASLWFKRLREDRVLRPL